ncbi:MAG: CHAT domain-containing protein, partial [Hyphomicrobium sp.]
EQEPKLQLDDDERRKMNSYRTFALGLLAADGTEEKLRLLVRAAAEQIAIFEETIPDSVEVIRIPDTVDKTIIRLGIMAASNSKPRDADLILRGAEILRRTLRTSLEDAVVLISAQRTPQARREVHSYLHLLDRKRTWETRKITDKVMRRPQAKPGQDVWDYDELVKQLAVSRQSFTRDQKSGDAAKHPLPTLKELQQTLGKNDAFLIHFDDVAGLGKLCVKKDATFVATSPLPKTLSDIAKSFRTAVATFPQTEKEASSFPFDAARELYAVLFGGLDDCLTPGTHVLIAEDQALAGLPYAALVRAEPPRKQQGYDLRAAKWLGQELSFSVVMSARHYLAVSHQLASAPTTRAYLGIGDPRNTPASGQSLASADAGDLPDADAELKAAATSFKAPKQDLLIGGQATEEAFRLRPIGDYDVLHFATHTFPVQRNGAADESALMLTSGNPEDPFDDGALTASEISRLTLNARLAVLSACATGTYKINPLASGVQDLQAAFGIAGVSTLLMTLWPVDSTATSVIIKDFFARWRAKAGLGASEALFEATSQYLRSADSLHTHPAFWAPFIVAGEGSLAERPTKSYPTAPAIDVLSDYPGYGDILQVSPVEDDILLSLITGFDGTKFKAVLTRRKQNGRTVWKMLPEGTGIVRAVVDGKAIYVSGYTTEAKPTPSIRRLDANGKLAWERAFPNMPGYVFADLAPTPDGIAVLATPTLADGEGNAISLMLLDATGRTLQMASISQESRPPIGREAALIRIGDRLIAAINQRPGPRVAFDRNSLTGYPNICYPQSSSKLIEFDVRTLRPVGEGVVPGLQVAALAVAGNELLLGGDIAQECSMFGTAAIFSKRGDTVRMIWKSDDPFKTKVEGLGSVGGKIKAIVAHERTLGNPSLSLERIMDHNAKRGAHDHEVVREVSQVTLRNDGRFVSENFVSSGLDVLLARSALTSGGSLVAAGTIGGNPALVTFADTGTYRSRKSGRPPKETSFWDW